MSDLFGDDLIPFAEGIRSLPGRPHISSGYRFISKGSHGVVLTTTIVGGRRFVSKRELKRWCEAVTAAAGLHHRPNRSVSVEVPPDTDVEKQLDSQGIV